MAWKLRVDVRLATQVLVPQQLLLPSSEQQPRRRRSKGVWFD